MTRRQRKITEPFQTFSRSKLNSNRGKLNSDGLDSIFKKPDNILFHGNFEDLKRKAQEEKKWILVSIIDTPDFYCQCLNRDTWSDPTLQNLISSYFIFWQNDYNYSEQYTKFYTIHSYPHISVLHPSGEQILFHDGFLDANQVLKGCKYNKKLK